MDRTFTNVQTNILRTDNDKCDLFKIVMMETFFGKRSSLMNIKIKVVTNKSIFSRDISIYFLKSFSNKIFCIISREKKNPNSIWLDGINKIHSKILAIN